MYKRCLTTNLAIILTLLAGCIPPPGAVLETPTSSASGIPEAEEVEILVYFTSTSRYAQGIQPYESPVIRRVPANTSSPRTVLEEFFKGPTHTERELDLEAITSGFTGMRSFELKDGYAHVYLEGSCHSLGATYTVAQPILRNLAQFPDIQYVKIYDEHGSTNDSQSAGHSIPLCLEP